jgi:hypothetical protein
MKIIIHRLIIPAVSVMLFSGCAANVGVRGKDTLAAQVFPVRLVPQGGGVLKVDTPNQGCVNNLHNGCIRFDENTVGLMKFYLRGSKKKVETCSTGARNVITAIQISVTGSGEKGDFSVLPLPEWIQLEAFPLLDRSTGLVYDKAVDDGASQVWMLNANANDAALGAREFWYRVTAKSCASPTQTWTSDPRGENEGTWQ